LRIERLVAIIPLLSGAVAQPGERLLCKEEVRGSSPLSSTTSPTVITTSEIPSYLIMILVGVGAALAIALIALVVRTR
jgi:hypothetical protein